jgi:hypothetical protein
VHGCIGGKLDTSISIIMNILMRAFAANSNMLHVTEGEHWRGVGGYINLVRSGTTLPFYIPLLHRITKTNSRRRMCESTAPLFKNYQNQSSYGPMASFGSIITTTSGFDGSSLRLCRRGLIET